jgi:hypothetical protein
MQDHRDLLVRKVKEVNHHLQYRQFRDQRETGVALAIQVHLEDLEVLEKMACLDYPVG